MDMQAAGIRLVRAVAHPNRTAQEFLPRHIPAVVIEAHRVRDQLETLRQRTIVFGIHLLLFVTIAVHNVQ